jgi:subtilisin family serine protease
VRRDAGLDRAERLALRQRADVRFEASLPLSGAELVRPEGSRAEALEALSRDPDVVYAEPDRRARADTNDADWGEQWSLENGGQAIFGGSDGSFGWQAGVVDADVDGPEAWPRSQGAGVTVAVVDSGIDASHPDLDGKVDTALGFDWVNGGEPGDANGHGTHVAGTIAAVADNGIGIAGMAPAARVAALRVLDDQGEGYSSDIASAFAYAGSRGLRIVNASLSGPYSELIAQAIASYPSTLFVVAAGNDGEDVAGDSGAYPCRLPYANVVCVGASDNQDQPAAFSNFSTASVDLFAPGVSIWSTLPANDYGRESGTSMAAPHVAGAAALALAANRIVSTAQLRSALLQTVDTPPALAGRSVTGGRLNADTTVQVAAAMTPEPTPTPTPTPSPTPTPTPTPPPAQPNVLAKLTSVKLSGKLRTSRSKLRVTFTLTAPATVRFTVTKRGARKALTTWTRNGRKGSNVVTLTRRLPTHRTLRRGAYTLSLRLPGSARSVRFSVS